MLLSSDYGSILIKWKFDFTESKILDEQRKQKIGFEPGIYRLADWRPRRHSHEGFTFSIAIFNGMMQHLLHSKVAKAESYLIGGYHNEWLELTYYIETLVFLYSEMGFGLSLAILFLNEKSLTSLA